MSDKWKRQYKALKSSLQVIIDYPAADGRSTKDGYPKEVAYDEFAYQRMVDSFRSAIRKAIKDAEASDG